MRLESFTANIIVDGKALEEYGVVSTDSTQATCWVASEEGKRFTVQWKCHEELRVTGARGSVHVDGIGCGADTILPGILGAKDTGTLSHYVGLTSTRDLMFARVQLSDDDSLLNQEVHKDLGQISLVIERGEVVMKPRSARDRVPKFLPGDNEKLHERSKKATIHRVGFGQEKTRSFTRYKRVLTRNNQPEITFVFKYQQLSILQANGLAPRSNSSATAGEREVGTFDNDTSEDTRPARLNNRIQTLENELRRLRGLQARDSEDREPKRIKTEDFRKERRLFAPGEIIDLT